MGQIGRMGRSRALLLLAVISLLFDGCVNTGVSLIVGERTIWPEVSDSGDNLGVKLYEDVKGARLWVRQNCRVDVQYKCAATNEYFGIMTTRSNMDVKAKVLPTLEELEEEADEPDETGGETEETTETNLTKKGENND